MFNSVFELYSKASSAAESKRCLYALAKTTDHSRIAQLLDFTLKSVRSQDWRAIFISIAHNPHGTALTWEFLKANWAVIYNEYEKSSLLASLIRGVSSAFSTQSQLDDMRVFFDMNPVPYAQNALEASYEIVAGNVLWLQHNIRILESIS